MKFVALVVIASADSESEMKEVAREAGAAGGTILEAKGSGFEEKRSFFSLTFEGNQTVILYLLEEGLSRKVLKALKLYIEEKDNDGLAFTTSINHVVGLEKGLLNKFEKNIEEEERF